MVVVVAPMEVDGDVKQMVVTREHYLILTIVEPMEEGTDVQLIVASI